MGEDEDVEYTIIPRKASWWMTAAIAFEFLENVAGAIETGFAALSMQCIGQVKYSEEQAAFHEQAMLEMETLTSTEE